MLGYALKYAAICCGALAIVGCAGSGDRYPSLAMRDSERFGGELTPAAATQPAEIVPVSPASISAALESASKGNTQFLAKRAEASRLASAASGTSQDSDTRSRALIALAQLTSLRSQTLGALASLDALKADAATRFAATQEIETAQEEVFEMLTTQNASISAIELEMGL